MRTARVRLVAGFDALVDREGLRRYTQADVSCPGQGFYTLAPDIFCRVHVVVLVPGQKLAQGRFR